MELTELRNRVASTKTFDGLSKIQKRFFIKYKNLEEIRHGLTVCENIGYEKWKQQTGEGALSNIVGELVKA